MDPEGRGARHTISDFLLFSLLRAYERYPTTTTTHRRPCTLPPSSSAVFPFCLASSTGTRRIASPCLCVISTSKEHDDALAWAATTSNADPDPDPSGAFASFDCRGRSHAVPGFLCRIYHLTLLFMSERKKHKETLFLETVPVRYYLLAVFQKKHWRHTFLMNEASLKIPFLTEIQHNWRPWSSY